LIIALNFTLTPLRNLLALRYAVSKASGIGSALEGLIQCGGIEIV